MFDLFRQIVTKIAFSRSTRIIQSFRLAMIPLFSLRKVISQNLESNQLFDWCDGSGSPFTSLLPHLIIFSPLLRKKYSLQFPPILYQDHSAAGGAGPRATTTVLNLRRRLEHVSFLHMSPTSLSRARRWGSSYLFSLRLSTQGNEDTR
jgi:hypothetical protein